MKVTPEVLTVFPERERREVDVIMAGLRITLTMEEAQLLAGRVNQAVADIRSGAALAAVDKPLRIAPAESVAEDYFPGEPKPSDIKFSGIRNLG
jgi:hypothetical protein